LYRTSIEDASRMYRGCIEDAVILTGFLPG
jgi:hypothetical protein